MERARQARDHGKEGVDNVMNVPTSMADSGGRMALHAQFQGGK